MDSWTIQSQPLHLSQSSKCSHITSRESLDFLALDKRISGLVLVGYNNINIDNVQPAKNFGMELCGSLIYPFDSRLNIQAWLLNFAILNLTLALLLPIFAIVVIFPRKLPDLS